ncbi:hypothetical protein [Nostoc sp. LPT]|nr:hypothetical protein [Nostoc sp. LPT]
MLKHWRSSAQASCQPVAEWRSLLAYPAEFAPAADEQPQVPQPQP